MNRRVLVVCPHFPPADAVDMHRVRMTVGHYRSCGWDPLVLHVRPEDTGRLVDRSLCETLPLGLEAVAVRAPGEGCGVRAIGLRAWRALNREGSDLLCKRRFDLVFISTTAFPLMSLGRVWKKLFGVPFVLDFQDPWATFPASAAAFIRRGVKHNAMRTLHRTLERWTLPLTDGLMAVNSHQIELLTTTYPALHNAPASVSPFGFSMTDFRVAEQKGCAVGVSKGQGGGIRCLYAGRVAPAMESSLRACFAVVAAGRRRQLSMFRRLRFTFLGTGYAASGNPPVASRIAAEEGIADQVCEHPDRVSFLDALKSMIEADILLVLGSEDDEYVPSKLNQCLALNKPVVCAAPRGSAITAQVSKLETVLSIPAGREVNRNLLDVLEDRLRNLTTVGRPELYSERLPRTRPYEAATAAKRDCALFDAVAAASAGWRAG